MEQTIKISSLNELLKNKGKFFVSEQKGYQGISKSDIGEGRQSEYNETFKIYRHPDFPQNLYMRETYHSDSYGYDDNLQSIDFVEAKEKKVTVFEILN